MSGVDKSVLFLQQQAEQRVRQREEKVRRLVRGDELAARYEKEKEDDDNERWMLILLAILLQQNGAPPELLVALLYLAL